MRFAVTGSPTISGTMCVYSITRRFAAAKMRFSTAAHACCASRSALDCLR
jgi:hypothetical protein